MPPVIASRSELPPKSKFSTLPPLLLSASPVCKVKVPTLAMPPGVMVVLPVPPVERTRIVPAVSSPPLFRLIVDDLRCSTAPYS